MGIHMNMCVYIYIVNTISSSLTANQFLTDQMSHSFAAFVLFWELLELMRAVVFHLIVRGRKYTGRNYNMDLYGGRMCMLRLRGFLRNTFSLACLRDLRIVVFEFVSTMLKLSEVTRCILRS